MALRKVETEIEIKAPAEKFNMAHHVPNISSGTIHGVQENVEFNDKNKSITLNGLEGDVFQYYKSFKPVYQFTQKDEGNIAKLSIEYEKLTEDVAAPDKYVGLMSTLRSTRAAPTQPIALYLSPRRNHAKAAPQTGYEL
ncbi:MLP-like protein 28 [Pyrus ussuriensis x Pyrus communis]|uniref:MLP-like protein 28 n=1 Tax=Pyrus ussuriensis x Pyrus communis TaxID=2448454 RepID=A0A5N5GZQ7_9ROSA|nr:MLP-like protein 28 [Pyrus ussuriensis x Pyrus communis]